MLNNLFGYLFFKETYSIFERFINAEKIRPQKAYKGDSFISIFGTKTRTNFSFDSAQKKC